MELFCFGTELGNAIAKRPQYWSQLIVKIRKIYTGKLTYAANWDDFDKVPFGRNLITLESMLIFRYLMPQPKSGRAQ
jgi:hypothetical protein